MDITTTMLNGLNQKQVTIVIPCYNQAHFLAEAIESALRQTYQPREVIVVNDGSTDHTAAVAARYPGVRLIQQANCGLAAARNRGMAAGRGEYLVFLDADDRLLPIALETGVECLRQQPECAFAYGHVRLISEEGAALPSPVQTGVHENHYQALLRRNYIWTPGTGVYRRGPLEMSGAFLSGVDACADYELHLRLASLFSICCHDRITLEYRKHKTNMTLDIALMLKSSVSVLQLQRRRVAGNEACRQALTEGIRFVCGSYGDHLLREMEAWMRAGDWKRVMHGFLTLLKYHPRGAAKACLPRKVVTEIRRLRSVTSI